MAWIARRAKRRNRLPACHGIGFSVGYRDISGGLTGLG